MCVWHACKVSRFLDKSTFQVLHCHRRFGILWRKIEGRLQRVSKIVIVCMLFHNLIIDFEKETRVGDADEEIIPTVAPHHARQNSTRGFSNATLADGVIPTMSHGTIVGHEVTRPEVHAQDECSVEEPPAALRGRSGSVCPHRIALRQRLANYCQYYPNRIHTIF